MDFSKEQKNTLKGMMEQVMDDRLRINNDILRQEMKAQENRLLAAMEVQKEDILVGVAEIIDNAILPQIDDHEVRLTKLETKMA